MNDILTLSTHLKTRGISQKEITLIQKEIETSYTEWSFDGAYIKSADNLKQIPLEGITSPKFFLIFAEYISDDNTIPVSKGMPAPFKVRLNDPAGADVPVKNGLFILCGELTSLHVSSDYENDIQLHIYIAG